MLAIKRKETLSFETTQVDPEDMVLLLGHLVISGKNTGVGLHFLFQGIFLTLGLKLHLLHRQPWQVDS